MSEIQRYAERASQERRDLDALLDEVPWGTLVAVRDGRPWVVPMLFARDGDRVLLHGSTGAGGLRLAASGASVAFSVTSVDGIVVAHTTFESSANYRSAVLHGTVTTLAATEKVRALDLLSDRLIPGRTTEVRQSNRKELAATQVLVLPIGSDWTYKSRSGPNLPAEEEHDAWMGVVEMHTAYGPVVPDESTLDRDVPESVRRLLARG